MIVIVRGPLLSVTGYGCHTRQVWKWARSQKGWEVYAAIVPWGMCTYYIDPAAEDGLIGDIMSRSSTPPDSKKPDLSLQVQLPDEWDPNIAVKNIGITAGIEADKCNQEWITAAKNMTSVIVPSEYSKLAFINGGLDPKLIHNVPEAITCGFNKTLETSVLEERLDGLSTDFNFLMFGQITATNVETDRKNTFNCLKWLCEELKDDPSAGVVIKTNMGRMTVQDREFTKRVLSQVISEVRTGPYPKIHVIHGLLNSDEIGTLYSHKKVKALCAPTRGEGWGLPILDSAASGLPIIATGHSGHMDFLKHIRFLDINYKLSKIPSALVDGRIWVEGARWSEPEETHFKSRVRKFRAHPTIPEEWAESSKQKIRDMYSIDAIMDIYDNKVGVIIDTT